MMDRSCWYCKILEGIGVYFTLVLTAPLLGFTAVLDAGYLMMGQPGWAALWIFVIGPALMAGLIRITGERT
jgi:hypothetical protein